MRKLITVVFLFLTLSFAACSGNEDSKKTEENGTKHKTEIPEEPEGFKSIHQRDYEKYKTKTGRNLKIDSVFAASTIELTDANEGKFYHPKVSGNGEYLFFTSQNYQGLWVKRINDSNIIRLSSGRGAGYKFVVSPDGNKVFYRLRIKGSKSRRTGFSLIMQNVNSGKIEIIVSSEQRISPPVLVANEVVYFVDGQLQRKKVLNFNVGKAADVVHFNGKVFKVDADTVEELNLREKNILSIELSPVSGDILFSVRGKGIYVYKNGKSIFIDSGENPVWSPDGRLITYTKEKSDGMQIKETEIFIASVTPVKIFDLNLTGETPVWHPDGRHIIYSDSNGKILQTEINLVYKEEK